MSNRRHQTRRWRLLANRGEGSGRLALPASGLWEHGADWKLTIGTAGASRVLANLGAIQSPFAAPAITSSTTAPRRRRKTDPAVRAWANALEELRI